MQRSEPLRPSTWAAVGLDSVIVMTAYAGALVLRFQGSVPSDYAVRFAASVILIVAAYAVTGLLFRVYSPGGTTQRVVAASFTSMCVVVAVEVFVARPLPLSVMVLGGLVSIVGLVGWRMAASAWRR